jgi:hypothetical protein
MYPSELGLGRELQEKVAVSGCISVREDLEEVWEKREVGLSVRV